MSNLVKQSYVIDTSKGNPRVIDSNDLVESRLRRLESIAAHPGSDEFMEGLVAEQVEVEPELTEEEIIESAKAEAKKILDEARERADHILNDADRKANLLFEEQKMAGFDAGMKGAEQNIEDARQQMCLKMQAQIDQNNEDYLSRVNTLEKDLVDVIIRVFDHVFRIQFEDKREILLSLVNNTISNIDSGKHFRIHVCPDDITILEDHLDEIQKTAGYDAVIEIVKDTNLLQGECRIETDFGMFDCGLDTELKNLYKDIRSLCV